MTPLEAAKALARQFEQNTGLALQGSGDHRACRVCKERLTYHEDAPAQCHHKSNCPILAMPQIVAALEAAETLAVAWEGKSYSAHWTHMKRAHDAYREVVPPSKELTGTTS